MSRQELQLGLVPLPGRPDESMSNVWADPRRQRAADGGRLFHVRVDGGASSRSVNARCDPERN